MSDPAPEQRPPTRRDLLRPMQLLGLAFAAALFAGIVTLVSTGFFQQRFTGQSDHALVLALIVAGITFIVALVSIALLMLAIDPVKAVTPIDGPVLRPPKPRKDSGPRETPHEG